MTQAVLLGAAATPVLPTIVTADMLQGVLAEITGLLPIVFPVVIGFMAIRKGVSFVTGAMRSA